MNKIFDVSCKILKLMHDSWNNPWARKMPMSFCSIKRFLKQIYKTDISIGFLKKLLDGLINDGYFDVVYSERIPIYRFKKSYIKMVKKQFKNGAVLWFC